MNPYDPHILEHPFELYLYLWAVAGDNLDSGIGWAMVGLLVLLPIFGAWTVKLLTWNVLNILSGGYLERQDVAKRNGWRS